MTILHLLCRMILSTNHESSEIIQLNRKPTFIKIIFNFFQNFCGNRIFLIVMNIKFIYKIQNITAASWWSPILTSTSTWVYVWTGASSTSKYLIWINEWLSNCQNTKQKICHSLGSFVVLNNLNNLILQSFQINGTSFI